MRRNVLFRLALVAITVGAMQTAKAGSAVVSDGARNLTTSYGHPVEIAKERALETAHRLVSCPLDAVWERFASGQSALMPTG